MQIIKTETGEFEYYNNDDIRELVRELWAEAAANGNEFASIMSKHMLADKPKKDAVKNAVAESFDLIHHRVNQKLREMKFG